MGTGWTCAKIQLDLKFTVKKELDGGMITNGSLGIGSCEINSGNPPGS